MTSRSSSAGFTCKQVTMDKLPRLINPDKCIVEGVEIISFEKEEHLDYYTIWHDILFDKRREAKAETDREKQIMRNEFVRKTSQFLLGTFEKEISRRQQSPKPQSQSPPASTRPTPTSTPTRAPQLAVQAQNQSATATVTPSASVSRATRPQPPLVHPSQPTTPNLPNGLTILNSSFYNTLPSGKTLMKYKLTKLYNKYRGRQIRRNFVHEKQRNAKIEAEVSKSFLNSWLAYTALQALRLTTPNNNNNTKYITTLSQIPASSPIACAETPSKRSTPTPTSISTSTSTPKATNISTAGKPSSSSKKQNKPNALVAAPAAPTAAPPPATTTYHQPPLAPMHLVYIDPGNIITYSNKLNPQQIADYRRKSHLLPSSASSKKSSAASYDVYEIMEVLANTNKTNVTITRNANRPAQPGVSVYSHSVNANTPGIVSTQLHLQARAYLDSMSKFYAEEVQRLEKEREEIKYEPTSDDLINKYLKVNQSYDSKEGAVLTTDQDQCIEQSHEELEKLEEDIMSMIHDCKST